MKQRFFLTACFLMLCAAAALGLSFSVRQGGEAQGFRSAAGRMVIANRASGTITVIDAASDEVVGTYALPAGEKTPEPMYVVYSRDRVFVGDRANNRVAVFNPRTFAVETTVAAGAGVFHMWADPLGEQLWVNNDGEKTCTVIDPLRLRTLATVPLPADLVAAGGRPHDVILDPLTGQSAFVTMIGVAGAADYVVKFSTRTFAEIGRAAVGKDPHVSATARNQLLYVPCQNSNLLVVLDRETLSPVKELAIPGAHGAGMAWDGATFYTTNISGGGRDALWTINAATGAIAGEAVDTPFATPHNIALTPGRAAFFQPARGKLFLTHSGATANQVTIYKFRWGAPVFHKTVTVGFNPFGLAFVP
jgi:DNA-binding beta-propeller fold protein YncE